MKPALRRSRILALMIVFAAFTSIDAVARTPQPRQLCGTIQQLDLAKQTFTVRPENRKPALVLVWKRDTRFIDFPKFSSSAALTNGLNICVQYHTPFFGKPFATKVVWAGK